MRFPNNPILAKLYNYKNNINVKRAKLEQEINGLEGELSGIEYAIDLVERAEEEASLPKQAGVK